MITNNNNTYNLNNHSEDHSFYVVYDEDMTLERMIVYKDHYRKYSRVLDQLKNSNAKDEARVSIERLSHDNNINNTGDFLNWRMPVNGINPEYQSNPSTSNTVKHIDKFREVTKTLDDYIYDKLFNPEVPLSNDRVAFISNNRDAYPIERRSLSMENTRLENISSDSDTNLLQDYDIFYSKFKELLSCLDQFQLNNLFDMVSFHEKFALFNLEPFIIPAVGFVIYIKFIIPMHYPGAFTYITQSVINDLQCSRIEQMGKFLKKHINLSNLKVLCFCFIVVSLVSLCVGGLFFIDMSAFLEASNDNTTVPVMPPGI